MPLYEYRCRTCETIFTEQRPMSRSSEPATCPDGHEARRVLSVFATAGRASGSSDASPSFSPDGFGGGGGGCCGGGCGCG